MLVFLINTFNESYYYEKANDLLSNIRAILNTSSVHASYVIVKGGCNENNSIQLANITYIDIIENLSDNNVFVGFQRNINELFNNELYKRATYILLHDTCLISNQFHSCMRELTNIKFSQKSQWIFAHTYGLYNIGICSFDFICDRASDFKDITILPKNIGILNEQGHMIEINNKQIPSLHHYSKFTLANMVKHTSLGNGVINVDTYGINGISENNRSPRWVAYISSLGVHKLIGSKMSYFAPIWAAPSHHPKDEDDLTKMKEVFGGCFIPLLPYKFD